jgi:carboxymethylenebutenolidase
MTGVLLLHAWWGLNEDVLAYAKRLRLEGFEVESPDVYGGQIAATIEAAKAMAQALDADQANAEIDRATTRLAPSGPYAIVGFSLGASLGWDLIQRRPGQAAAFVAYYGTGSRDFPDRLPRILGHFAELDDFEPSADVAELERTLRERGADVTHHSYPGMRHWFAEPSRPEFDQRAADLAWQRTLAFLRRAMG